MCLTLANDRSYCKLRTIVIRRKHRMDHYAGFAS
jgi:hypothetical protein